MNPHWIWIIFHIKPRNNSAPASHPGPPMVCSPLEYLDPQHPALLGFSPLPNQELLALLGHKPSDQEGHGNAWKSSWSSRRRSRLTLEAQTDLSRLCSVPRAAPSAPVVQVLSEPASIHPGKTRENSSINLLSSSTFAFFLSARLTVLLFFFLLFYFWKGSALPSGSAQEIKHFSLS